MMRALLSLALVVNFHSAVAQHSTDVAACLLAMNQAGKGLVSPDITAVAQAIRDFGFGLHEKLHGQPDFVDKGLTTSPFSLMSALGMVLNGVDGVSLAEVAAGMQIGALGADAFNSGYQQLATQLRTNAPGNTLTFGNLIFADLHYPLLPEFVGRLGTSMGAESRNWDIQGDPNGAKNFANQYISDQTRGMLPNLLNGPPGELSLINAGFYKGGWEVLFDVAKTRADYDFRRDSGFKKVPMMFQHGKTFLYTEEPGFQMVSLVYKQGEFAMDVIVPKRMAGESFAEALKRVSAQMTGNEYAKWVGDLRLVEIATLGLPRWESNSKVEGPLRNELASRMPSIFSPAAANFSRMTTVQSYVDSVIHAAKLQTNELGSKGAFATAVGIRATSGGPVPQVSIIADHPFVSVIRHVATGMPLFISSVVDPEPLPAPTAEEIAKAQAG